jgi:hypothetical protein
MPVFQIGISNNSLGPYFVDVSTTAEPGDAPIIRGASSSVSNIIGQVAMGGKILDFQSPTKQPNATYRLQSYLPLLRCSPANSTEQSYFLTQINSTIAWFTKEAAIVHKNVQQSFNHTTFQWTANSSGHVVRQGEIGYFAGLPYLPQGANQSQLWTGATSNEDSELASTRPASIDEMLGDVLFAIPTYRDRQPQIDIVSCEFYNASVSYAATFSNHAPTLSNITTQWLNSIDPVEHAPSDQVDSSNSYGAYFYELALYIVGIVEFSDHPLDYEIVGEVATTSLGLSSQFSDAYQRIITLAQVDAKAPTLSVLRNVSFSDTVQDYSLNASLGLLSDPALWSVSHPFEPLLKYESMLMTFTQRHRPNPSQHYNNRDSLPLRTSESYHRIYSRHRPQFDRSVAWHSCLDQKWRQS